VVYKRTTDQQRTDYHDSKVFEGEVAKALGPHIVDRTDSATELDFWLPGFILETKERKQPIGQRWLKHAPEVDPDDLFILDELSLRKALKHWPEAYFLLRDRVFDRLFIASITELCVVPRTRVLRVGKAKLLYDLKDFRRISHLDEIVEFIRRDLSDTPWKVSGAVGARVPAQV
jgi:hypothetical protein